MWSQRGVQAPLCYFIKVVHITKKKVHKNMPVIKITLVLSNGCGSKPRVKKEGNEGHFIDVCVSAFPRFDLGSVRLGSVLREVSSPLQKLLRNEKFIQTLHLSHRLSLGRRWRRRVDWFPPLCFSYVTSPIPAFSDTP